MSGLGTWLAKLVLPPRPKERALAPLERAVAGALWLHLFLLIVVLAIGRSVGSAVFLRRFDGAGLAVVYIFVGLAVSGAMLALDRIDRSHGTLLASVTTLVVAFLVFYLAAHVAPLLPLSQSWAYGLIYLFIEIFAFVATVQFWTAANCMLTLDQASRLYVFVGAGGIFGSIVGGALTRLFASNDVAWAFSLMAGIIPVQILLLVLFQFLGWRLRRADPKSSDQWNLDASTIFLGMPSSLDGLPSDFAPRVRKRKREKSKRRPIIEPAPSRSLTSAFCAVSFLMVFATTLVDFYYKMFADYRYSGDIQRMTSFFGGFYLSVGLLTLLVQTVLTPRILARYSAFAGVFAAPMALTAGALLNVISPSVWAAACFKLMDSAVTHSVYRSCQEMLYTPLPTYWARRIKTLADGVSGRLGLLFAGVCLLAMAPLLQRDGPTGLLPWVFGSLAVWTIAIWWLKREYLREARRRPARSEADEPASEERGSRRLRLVREVAPPSETSSAA